VIQDAHRFRTGIGVAKFRFFLFNNCIHVLMVALVRLLSRCYRFCDYDGSLLAGGVNGAVLPGDGVVVVVQSEPAGDDIPEFFVSSLRPVV
jgi:hypothetical protein